MSGVATLLAVAPLPLAENGEDAVFKIIGFVVIGVIVLIYKAVKAVRDVVAKQQQGKGNRPGPPARKTMGPQAPVPPWKQPAPPQRSRKGGRSRKTADMAAVPQAVVAPVVKRPPPLPAAPPPVTAGAPLAARLVRPQNLRAAVLLAEILKPPVALRDEEARR